MNVGHDLHVLVLLWRAQLAGVGELDHASACILASIYIKAVSDVMSMTVISFIWNCLRA